MTDKQTIIDVTQCPYYKEDKICTYLPYKSKCEGDCNWTAYKEMEEKLKAKEQECEELKEEIKKHNDDMFKNPPEKRFYCKGCTLPYISKKLKQTLTEIKEIASKVLLNTHDLEQFKDADALFVSLLKIHKKISECEVE